MPTAKKIESVKKLNENLKKAKSLALTNHTGLTHQQMEKLRRNINKNGGYFSVVKNTLLKKALADTFFSDKVSEQNLQGPTSLLLSYEDEISALSELFKFQKDSGLPTVKQGALTDRILTGADVLRIGQLPSKEVLLAQLTGMLKNPQSRLVFALKGNLMKLVMVVKAISEKKN